MEYYGETITGEVRGYSYNPRTGWQQIVVYTGTPSQIEIVSANAISNGYSVRYVPDSNGTYATLEVTYGAAETQDPAVPLSDEWSLVGNDLEKSIFEHPNLLARQDGWSSDDKLIFRTIAEANARGDGQSFIEQLADLEVRQDGAVVLLEEIKDELAKGVEAFTVSQFVLRHTTVITSNSTIKPNNSNVGKVFKTGSPSPLKNWQGSDVEAPDITSDGITIPDTIKFTMPDGYWLKRTPSVEQYGTDKWQVTQEYWHADTYSTFLYKPAT